ncbi:hypothetical protein CLIB1423_14S02630 [[Candida] railenensis]|uniref:Uncharacterized protein n=1 Tax=[Candida] railenensis TaxID=45579 RepID=A0A9P0QT61_9ASCO|nr:hypothetical protein CLIB1423_14S02630 [[Candida] railenensis]
MYSWIRLNELNQHKEIQTFMTLSSYRVSAQGCRKRFSFLIQIGSKRADRAFSSPVQERIATGHMGISPFLCRGSRPYTHGNVYLASQRLFSFPILMPRLEVSDRAQENYSKINSGPLIDSGSGRELKRINKSQKKMVKKGFQQ